MKITAVDTYDIRFPTSRDLDGSDAMNPDPDYSAAYVVLRDRRRRSTGTASPSPSAAATRSAAAIDALAPLVIGHGTSTTSASSRRRLTHDSQLRWLGPEKGVMHMAAAAVVNAAWDLAAKVAGKPLWRLLSDMTPRADRRPRRLPLPDRRAHPGRGARHPAGAPSRARRARSRTSSGRLPGLHDVAGLARLRRREAGPAGPGGGRRRLLARSS